MFDANPSHQRKKKPKILNFIKFSQNGLKESALTEKRAKKMWLSQNAEIRLLCFDSAFETIRHRDIIESNAFFSAIKVVGAACTTAQSRYFSNTPRMFIRTYTVEAAINEFQPFKAPGPDGLYPVLLQKG